MTAEETLEVLLEQERRLQFHMFDNDTAFVIGMALVDRGRREKLTITVDVTRVGQQLFHVALPGTQIDNDEWIKRKNAVVYRFSHSSYYIGSLCRAKGVSFEERYLLDSRQYAPHGGAFPIIVEGAGVVGTVTLSGLDEVDDHRLVVEEIGRYLG